MKKGQTAQTPSGLFFYTLFHSYGKPYFFKYHRSNSFHLRFLCGIGFD